LNSLVKKVSLVMCFFQALFPLFARDVEITVHDAELGLPLEGAVIHSWDSKQYICDRNGKALITAPDDRQVLIQIAYPGYESGRLVITTEAVKYILGLRLSGIMESKELVIEAAKPGSSETKTGRSVSISGRNIAQTGEIGIIEDVMKSVKLLPGVGYAGLFNAHPSIRGGDPGDMTASLNGFYIMNPYHWGGSFSIFDPRMVQSAQLSHGVFSTRYGHSISGLLDITAKKPSPTEMEFELGINTSAANFSYSLPLAGKGGLLFMGRVTFYDPIVWLMKQLSASVEALDPVNSIRVAPYIRSGTVTGNYRFSDNLELQAAGFWGMDGVGATYENSSVSKELNSDSGMNFDWTNYQGFFTTGLSWNPRSDMLLKFSVGAGYEDAVIDGDFQSNIHKKDFSSGFKDKYKELGVLTKNFTPYEFTTGISIKESDAVYNVQGRIDYDWELKNGFLFAAGIQEITMQFNAAGDQQVSPEMEFSKLDSAEQEKLKSILSLSGLPVTSPVWKDLWVSYPARYAPDAGNRHFTTSGYSLIEYHTPDNRFKTELGLRVDHFFLSGKGFSLQSKPALNPRLNVDFNVFQNIGVIQSFDLSTGTGLFSSMNNMVSMAEKKYNLSEIRPNRSWTSVLGAKLEFPEGLFLNIEGYYKYVFDRTYIPINMGIDDLGINPQFDGEGRVWGIDLMLQKLQSRYWDGWLSYSFSWAQYRDPGGGQSELGISGGTRGNDWYFPQYHRFHNLNLVLNIKPIPNINIYTRFGFASGAPLLRHQGDHPVSRPVFVYNPDDPTKIKFIEKYFWPSVVDEDNRSTPSFPLDVKFSIFGGKKDGKTRYELYVAVENILALLYTAQGNTRFNQYTGEVDAGSDSASYEMPFPIPSFGFKISY